MEPGSGLLATFSELTHARVSVRDFEVREVPVALLDAALLASSPAPSAGNLHGYRLFVCHDSNTRAAIGEAAGQGFVARAPIVLVAAADAPRSASKYGRRGADLYSLQDATIFLAHTQLALTAVGLSSCWVGAFNERMVASTLGIREAQHLRPVALLAVTQLL